MSDRIMVLYKREVWNKLCHCLNSLCASSLPNIKEQPFCFMKSSSLNFGFHSLGNKLNFVSNQKAGKIINVTKNKLLVYQIMFRSIIKSVTKYMYMHRYRLTKCTN